MGPQTPGALRPSSQSPRTAPPSWLWHGSPQLAELWGLGAGEQGRPYNSSVLQTLWICIYSVGAFSK